VPLHRAPHAAFTLLFVYAFAPEQIHWQLGPVHHLERALVHEHDVDHPAPILARLHHIQDRHLQVWQQPAPPLHRREPGAAHHLHHTMHKKPKQL
jgi:hypothetical protein